MARILRTERGLDRLVNFSDATVAIAITLLLLPLVDVAAEIDEKSLAELLGENWGTLLAFVVSFAVISRLWVVHHKLFEAARSYSDGLMRVNFVWLASIAFLPFSSNLIAHDYGHPGVNALYIGTIAVSSAALLAMQRIMLADPELLVDGAHEHLTPLDSLFTTVSIVVALVLAVVLPSIGMWWLLLLVPAGWIGSALDRRRTAR
jgi:uncharacterized membrane protein